jgi:hypothetical protein
MPVILGKQCDGLAVAVQRSDVDVGGAGADGAGASSARDPAFTSVTPTPIAAPSPPARASASCASTPPRIAQRSWSGMWRKRREQENLYQPPCVLDVRIRPASPCAR